MKISLSCSECNTQFQLENYDLQRRLRLGRTIIYCSRGCASINSNKQRAKKREFECLNCHKKETLNESDGREFYCSKNCYFEHQKDRLQEQARKIGKDFAEKISKTKKEMFASGELIHPF